MIRLSGDAIEITRHLFREREVQLGRPLRPRDTMVPEPFDLAAYRRSMVAGLLRLGARADVIHAFEETTRIVLPGSRQHLDEADLAEWDAVMAAYHADHPDEEPTDVQALQEALTVELHRTATQLRPQ